MKHLPKFLLIPELLLAISLAPFMAMNAHAADQNTYRAGSPYLQVHANSAQQCEQQCQGDAQCRGWNFVRRPINTRNGNTRNENAGSGICEFNARLARALPSPSSISGTMSTNIDSLMRQAVSGGTHTVRVGTGAIAAAKPTEPSSVRRSSRRIVKRQPIPAQRATRPVMHRRTLPAQTNRAHRANRAMNPRAAKPQIADPRKPRIYGGQKQQATQPAPQQRHPQQQLSEQQRYRQEFLRRRQQRVIPQANRQAAPRAQDNAQRHRQAILRAQRAAALAAPTQPAQRQRPIQRPRAQRPQAPRPAQSPVPQQQFSYGSLHDDITKNMSIVARPKTAPDNFDNPDAPISTSRAMPTKPVETRPLASPVLSGLAGG